MRTIELTWDEQSSSNYYIREAFNTLRANILFSGKHVKVILVTSCFAHEGKSSISFDLCRNLAESGKKVLLVDADLRKSVMVSRYTKERGVYGLSQILSGQVDAANAVYHTSVEGMDLVFAGPYPPNPTELAGSPAFKEFVDSQRNQYDYIIIDAPPLGLVIDAAVMSTACDGAVMVINIGHVKYRVAQNVKNQLEKSGCKVLGVVLNQIDRKRSIRSSNSAYYSSYDSYGGESGGKSRMGGIKAALGSLSGERRPQQTQAKSAAPTEAKRVSPTVATTPTTPTASAAPSAAPRTAPGGVAATRSTAAPANRTATGSTTATPANAVRRTTAPANTANTAGTRPTAPTRPVTRPVVPPKKDDGE